jgi:hypothetical protein
MSKRVTIELEEGHGIIWYLGLFAIILLVVAVVGTVYYFTLDTNARNTIAKSMTSKLSLNNTGNEISNLSHNAGSEFSNLSNKTKGLSNKTRNLTNNIPN